MRKHKMQTFLIIYVIVGMIVSAGFSLLNIKPALAAACEGSGNNVTIATDCTMMSGTNYTYTGTLTINTGVTVTVNYNSETPGQAVIQSDTIVVTGNISANGQGFPAGVGTGAGTDTGGGGYGGAGGGTVGGSTYGSATSPTDLGSGGTGSAGGGSIKLEAGSITLNGTVSANGANTPAGGAGSGGSVWILSTGGFTGSGTITADGGTGETGGGGGGRIRVSSTSYSFNGSVSAQGSAIGGQAGTISFDTPTPTITSLSPSSVAVGVEPGTISIYGANFESSASTKLDGTSKETAYINSGQVNMLNVAAFAEAGTHSITVYNSLSGKTSDPATFTVTEPTPVLDGISPSTKFNNSNLTLQLLGSNFLGTSVAYIDGSSRTTTYVSGSEITMTLTSSDLASPGTKAITVKNGSQSSGAINLTVATAGGSGGGSGAGASSPTGETASPTIPAAGFGKALGPNSIRWYFSSNLNNVTGFSIQDAATGSIVASSTDVSARYLDETGLSASTTYCNRQIRAIKDEGLTQVQASSLFPCATTKKLEMASSSEFIVNPIKLNDLGVENISLGWTVTSSRLGTEKLYGFYVPNLNLWANPTSTVVATTTSPTAGQISIIHYLLEPRAFYQKIESWGQDFNLKGLESETPYKFWIVGTDNPRLVGSGVWQFTATTTPGQIIFMGEMELVSTSTQSIPTTSPLSALGGAAGKALPSFGSLAFAGMLAFVVQHRKRGLRNCAMGLCKVATSVEPKDSLRVVTAKRSVRKVTNYHKGLHHTTMVAFWLFCAAALVKSAVVVVGVMSDPLTAYGAGADQVTVMTYELKFKNSGTKTAKNVNVVDPIPAGSVYYPGSLQVDGVGQTDAQDGDSAWYSATPAEAHFHWDSVAPGVSHVMRFGVYPQSGVNADQINNSAYMPPPDNADPGTLNFYIHEQSICGNGKIEIERDAQGNAIMTNGKVLWEACDDGANNGKGYGWCKADCSGIEFPPANLCGNGKIDSWVNLKTGQTYQEKCDDGALNGQPGHCNKSCDGHVALPPPPKKPEPPKKQEAVPESAEQQQVPSAPSGSATATVPELTTTTAPVREATTTVIVLLQSTTTAAAPVIPSTLETVTQTITNGVNRASEVLANPTVQETTIPTIGILAAVNVAASVGWVTLFNYLYYIFTQPIMLFSRRKREKYGVVYNSLTKLPVDLAAVRLKDANGRIIQTKVTDRQGRYTFLANKGQYTLDISKAGYNFPSTLLTGKYMDVDYVDLLTTNKLVFSAPAAISNNIPIDPNEDKRLPGQVKRKAVLRDVQGTIAGLTTLLSVGAVLLVPSYQYIGLALFQLVTYLLFRRLTYRKPKSFGVVRDAKGKPVKNAVVRILDAQFNRVLETQVTDSEGRYAFLVGKGKFYITATKEGLGQIKSEVLDYSTGKGSMVVDKNLKFVVPQKSGVAVRT